MPNDNSEFKNDWTLMFFFASDNTLAPLLVSQLKDIKYAGFQEHTEVLVYFDPLEKDRPTKIYNVNSKRKASALARWEEDKKYPKSLIGDSNDSYVRKMDGDEVDPKDFSSEMQEAMAHTSTTSAFEMLGHFVDYGIKNHKARNYMLFLIGHGMLVGRAIFLPDEDPVSGISMDELKKIMEKFGPRGETRLRLLNLHSCSMSALEVAYQLRGTANYMIAHQGPAFVNSWPYRQLLKKILNTIEKEKRQTGEREPQGDRRIEEAAAEREHEDDIQREEAVKNKQVNVERLVEKLYYHLLYNATDFLTAGYSADLALLNLEEEKVSAIKIPLQQLVKKLKEHLDAASPIKGLILLAHWDSQSFWEENYTDLYDFCLCLGRRCLDLESNLRTGSESNPPTGEAHEDGLVTELESVKEACREVIKVLSIIKSPERSERFKKLVIHANNFGTKYQYSRGLSVYFPWCEPLDDESWSWEQPNGESRPESKGRNQEITQKYLNYDFTTDFPEHSWWSFLDVYFKKTKRLTRKEEDPEEFAQLRQRNFTDAEIDHFLERAESAFNADGSLGSRTPEVGRTPDTGVDCTCPTIKNYPTDRDHKKKFSITPGALRAFRSERQDLIEEAPFADDDSEDE